MKSSHKILFLLAGAFVLGAIAGNGLSLRDTRAQGYEGLIPDNNASGNTQQPQGYPGLIPGYVPDTAESSVPQGAGQQTQQQQAAGEGPAPMLYAPPRMDRNPFRRTVDVPPAKKAGEGMTRNPQARARTLDDIKTVQMMPAEQVKWDKIPAQLEDTLGRMLSPAQKDILSVPRMRVDGMLPNEFMAKRQVEQIMDFVRDPNQTPEQRAAAVKKAEQKLKAMANGYVFRRNVPEDFYAKMGLPGIYVREEQESARNALARTEAALAELRKYR